LYYRESLHFRYYLRIKLWERSCVRYPYWWDHSWDRYNLLPITKYFDAHVPWRTTCCCFPQWSTTRT